MSSKELRGAVSLSHFFLEQRLKPGDFAIDATCGNGNDTLLMARLVGETGKVWSFDIQEVGLLKCREKLSANGFLKRVSLILAPHENLVAFIDAKVSAAVFNLGFLPGGNRKLITRPDTTMKALGHSLELLLPCGMLLVSLYTEHPGGKEEEAAVLKWASSLPPSDFHVWIHRQANRSANAPYLLHIEKSAGSKDHPSAPA